MSTSIGHIGWWWCGWFAGLFILSACPEDATTLTQIVVVIDSDLHVPDQLDHVQIEISGAKEARVIDAPVDTEEHKLPRSLGLLYSGGPLGPIRVVARGQHGGETVVERMAEVHFEKDRTLKLALPLTRACVELATPCEVDQTCDQGVCVPAAVSLPVFDGDDGSFITDAGTWVIPVDAAVRDAGVDPDTGADAGVDAGRAPPTCTIQSPEDGDRFYAGDEISFAGSCLGAEGESFDLRWASTLAKKVGSGSAFTNSKLDIGTHEISLCAQGTSACASPVQIVVEALPEVHATITGLVQQGASDELYSADAELVAQGEGTGVPPLELTWIDSFAGEVARGAQCTFSAPLLPGRHLLRLVVKDARGRVASAERGFVARAPGRASLFETYALASSVLSTSGAIKALASDGNFHYVGTDAGYVLKVEAAIPESMSPSVTPTGLSEPRPEVRGLFLHESSNTLYLATSSDVQTCDVTNGTVKNCAKLTLGNFGSSMPRCVRRVSQEGADYVIVGTGAGVWVGASTMLDQGSLRATSSDVSALAQSAGKLWIAGSKGLLGYTLGAAGGLSGEPAQLAGGPNGLGVMAAAGEAVWAAPNSGVLRYDASGETWTTWTTSYTEADFGRLVHNEVRSLAITHPVIDGLAHDVIWIATAAGLSRFDPAVESFTTYTKADGLPDNSVLRVVALPSNELLLATPAGLAIHRGQ